MSADRCEPPVELRDVDGLHVILPIGEDAIFAEWRADQQVWRVIGGDWKWEPADLGVARYRYIAPIPSPAAVAALVKAARELDRLSLVILSAVHCADRANSDVVTAAILALRAAAFPQPKDTDNAV